MLNSQVVNISYRGATTVSMSQSWYSKLVRQKQSLCSPRSIPLKNQRSILQNQASRLVHIANYKAQVFDLGSWNPGIEFVAPVSCPEGGFDTKNQSVQQIDYFPAATTASAFTRVFFTMFALGWTTGHPAIVVLLITKVRKMRSEHTISCICIEEKKLKPNVPHDVSYCMSVP